MCIGSEDDKKTDAEKTDEEEQKVKKEKRLKQVFAVFGLCAVMAAVPAGIVNAEDAGSGSTEMEV